MSTLLLLIQRQHVRLLTLIVSAAVLCISSQAQFRYTTNKAIVKDTSFLSKVLDEERKISIYRPEVFPEYAEAVPPVIYVLDADAYTYYFANMINMMCERLVQMPPIKVVGVHNFGTPQIRMRDFTPLVSNDSMEKKISGAADKFLRFIQEEVMPIAEKDYKKAPFRVITGHSLSSFLVLHAFLQHPTLFNAYLASDPALGINNDAYLKIADSIIKNTNERNGTSFLNAGMDNWAQFYAGKIDSLLQNKRIKGLSHQYVIYPNETHLSVFLKSYYDGFHFIFNMDPPEVGKKPADITYKLFKNHYASLSKIFGYTMKPPQNTINDLGKRFLEDWNNTDKALEFFKKNIENYPQSSDAYIYYNYGEALLKKGDKKNALISFEKAFELDPKNTKAREMVNNLKMQ